MAALVQLRRQSRRKQGPVLTPALREFLDRVVVPALVDCYLAERGVKEPLARGPVKVAEYQRTSVEVVE